MSDTKTQSFQDVMDEIEDLDVQEELAKEKASETPAETDTPAETPGTDEAPQDTPPETPAKADDKPGAEDTGEGEEKVSDDPPAPPEGKPEDTAQEPVKDGVVAPDAKLTVTIGGKQYTPEQAEALLKSGERYTELQGEFTRRNQESAREREKVTDRENLLAEMDRHEGIQDLISRHPKVVRHLLSDPASTRALMGDAKQLESFVNDYEVLSQNPSLAERFAAGPQTPEAQRELAVKRATGFMEYVGGSVDNAISHVLQGTDGKVSKEDVEGYLKDLVGLDENADPASGFRAFQKLHSLMFVPAADGKTEEVDVSLLQKFVSSRSATREASQTIKTTKADAHNQRVDQALKAGKEEKAPVLGDGSSPGSTPDKPKEYKNFQEVLRDIEE